MQTQINWHSIRTYIYLICIATVAVLGAIQVLVPSLAVSLTGIIFVLQAIEHETNGNSGPIVPSI